MKHFRLVKFARFVLLALVISGCQVGGTDTADLEGRMAAMQAQMDQMAASSSSVGSNDSAVSTGEADVSFTLKTGGADGKLVFFGVGGKIDGMVNPTLKVGLGDVVKITQINGQAVEHDLLVEQFDAATGSLLAEGEERIITFVADKEGPSVIPAASPVTRLRAWKA